MGDFYETRFGTLRIWCSEVSTTAGNALAIHEPTVGNNYVVQRRGKVVQRATAELLFDDIYSDPMDPQERLNQFKALAAAPRAYIFAHPIEGSYLARVESFEHRVDSKGVISGTATFIPSADVDAVLPAGGIAIPPTGASAVASAAAEHNEALAAAGLSNTLGAKAEAAAEAWATTTTTPREVLATTSTLTSDIGDAAATYDDDLELWEAQRTAYLLADSVRLAADAATADSAATFAIKLGTAQSLRPLLANIFGADVAEGMYYTAMGLNDLDNPATIPAGSELILPVLPPVGRQG